MVFCRLGERRDVVVDCFPLVLRLFRWWLGISRPNKVTDDFTDEECLRYYHARMVQDKGVNSPTPTGARGATWGAWFVSRYGETLKQYAERARAGGFREKAERARKRIAEQGPIGHKPK